MDYSKEIAKVEIYNQYDGKFPILKPDYKDKQYLKHFEKLKTLIEEEEFTLVANHLAELVLNKLASNYNAWYVKRMCYQKGLLTLESQILWTRAFLLQNVKNFQGWEYRRFLIEQRGKIEDELDYVDQVLQIQQKNYHVWAYKVQITQKFNLYEQQKTRILKWIEFDIMNNSAWSYRRFLFSKTIKQAKDIKEQIDFTLFCIKKNINNLAAWNYLRGWFPSIRLDQFAKEKQEGELRFEYDEFPIVLEFCLELAKEDQNALQAMITLVHVHSQKVESLEYALAICEVLAVKEVFKETYWRWVERNLKGRLEKEGKKEGEKKQE